MNELTTLAASLGTLLKERKETIAVAESSAGGLISAALLAVPGASAYFLGGSVIYAGGAARVATRAGLVGQGDPLEHRGVRAPEGTDDPRAPRGDVGTGRDGGKRADGQPLRRRAGPCVPGGGRPGRAGRHAGDP